MILMNKDITYLVGDEDISYAPLEVYSDLVCAFLDVLSKTIMKKDIARQYSDVITFAFWCRKSNIVKLKEEYYSRYKRVGRGMVFHIAPSNVPINFAFSLAWGLLAGNSNIVRVSEKKFGQVEVVCDCIKECLEQQEFLGLKKYICIVRYPHNKEITDAFSANCSSRVTWGGDNTINEIRKSDIPCRANEMTFSDRYSFAIFDETMMENASRESIGQIADKFYNDTYLMDQNACSSPHLVIWRTSKERRGRERFWNALQSSAEKYDLQAKKVVDKYTLAAELAATGEIDFKLRRYSNYLYVGQLIREPDSLDKIRGRFGMFFETNLNSVKELCQRINARVQTCVVYGIDAEKLAEELIEDGCIGIDRIVPVGKAMDIGMYWDGYDVIGCLSRAMVVE